MIAAFLERWWFGRAWGEQGSLTSAFYYGDAPRFTSYAIAILKGESFDNGIPFHPPGWPLVLAGFLRLAGAAHNGDVVIPVAAVRLFLAATSALAVGVTTVVAWQMSGFGAMLAVAVLAPFHFGHIVEGTVPNSEALYSLGVAAFMWAMRRWLSDDGDRFRAPLAGIIGGCTLLVRAEFLAALAIAAAAGWAWGGRRRRDLPAFAIAAALVLLPTTVWHWRTLSAFNMAHRGAVAGPLPRFAPVTSYGPFNFAMANHEDADGGPNRDHPMLDACSQETDVRLSAGELDLACPQVYDLYVHGYRIGAAWLLSHPFDALALMRRKAAYTFGFLAHGYGIDDLPAGVDGVRRRVDMLDPDNAVLFPFHVGLIVAGFIALRRRRVAIWTIVAPLGALVGATFLFYGYVRVGVAYLPAIWVLQGAGAAAVLRLAPLKKLTASAAAGLAVAGITVALGIEAARLGGSRGVVLEGPRTPDGAIVADETLRIRAR